MQNCNFYEFYYCNIKVNHKYFVLPINNNNKFEKNQRLMLNLVWFKRLKYKNIKIIINEINLYTLLAS